MLNTLLQHVLKNVYMKTKHKELHNLKLAPHCSQASGSSYEICRKDWTT